MAARPDSPRTPRGQIPRSNARRPRGNARKLLGTRRYIIQDGRLVRQYIIQDDNVVRQLDFGISNGRERTPEPNVRVIQPRVLHFPIPPLPMAPHEPLCNDGGDH